MAGKLSCGIPCEWQPEHVVPVYVLDVVQETGSWLIGLKWSWVGDGLGFLEEASVNPFWETELSTQASQVSLKPYQKNDS